MHINRTDLNLFVVFESVYSQGGVTRAAAALNLSQPTISHALSRLRDRLGDPLFVRQGQKLAPTPLARRIIGPVREALQIFQHTLGDLDGFAPETAQMDFTIGMRSLLESTFLVPLVLLLARTAPGISVSSSPIARHRLEPALATGELSAVIDVFLPVSGEMRRQHLGGTHSVVVARQGHPLVRGALDLQTYLTADHVLLTSRPHGLGMEDQILSRGGHSRCIRARCQEINTAMRIVAGSDMLLTVSRTLGAQANRWFDNQILPAPFEAEPVDTYLYWHRSQDADPANIWLRRMIERAHSDAGLRVPPVEAGR